MRIGKNLDLNMPGFREVALHQQVIAAEGSPRQPLRGFNRGRHFVNMADHLHALAAAAGAGLDDERESHPRG